MIIFLITSFQIYISPGVYEEQQKSEMNKVLKGSFLAGRLITCAHIIFGHILPLIKGKQFPKFLSNKGLCAIDRNTRNANKIIGSLITGLTKTSTFLITYSVTSENNFLNRFGYLIKLCL
jgi:hypothetical protein